LNWACSNICVDFAFSDERKRVHHVGLSHVFICVGKVRFYLEQATEAQRVSRSIALPFHDLGT
jgi:hypothetical protein